MKKILIVKCRDSMLWYSKYVGQEMPFLREELDFYMSRQPEGYTNIVYKTDAVIVADDQKQ